MSRYVYEHGYPIDDDCEEQQKQTNYDRIRSMSVKRLADFLNDISNCEINDCRFCPLNVTGACNYKSIKKWLLSEVSDNER